MALLCEINRILRLASIIKKLAKELTAEYGKGYTKTNLYHFYSFYKTYPEIFHSASGKLLLSWTHYRTLLQVNDKDARDWYEKEALEQTWSVATLQRNISSQYYYRMLQTQRQDLVENEMKELTAGYQNDKYEFIKQMYCFMNNFAAKSTKCGKNLWSVYFSSSRTVVNVKSCALSN